MVTPCGFGPTRSKEPARVKLAGYFNGFRLTDTSDLPKVADRIDIRTVDYV